MDQEYDLSTLAVRAGSLHSQFGEHSEAIFLTSSFAFDSAASIASAFANTGEAYTYSRFSNPTVAMFQDRLAALEGAERCIATASRIGAVLACRLGAPQAGEHLQSS